MVENSQRGLSNFLCGRRKALTRATVIGGESLRAPDERGKPGRVPATENPTPNCPTKRLIV